MPLSEQVPFSAEPTAGWCWNNKNGSATALPAGIPLQCSLCPCGVQPGPPEGAELALGARSTSGLSSTVAQSGPQPSSALCQPSSTSALLSFSAASAPLQGNPEVYSTGKVSLLSSPLLSATEMCVTETISKGFNQPGCQSPS